MPDRDIDDLLLDLREAASPAGSEAIAEARLIERLDRTFSRDDRSLRGAFRTARRTMLALVAVGGVLTGAAATGAIALAAIPNDGSQRTAFEAPTANPTRVAYAAVAKSTQKPGRDVERIFGVLAKRYGDVDPARARGVKAADGTQAWVLPGTARTCFGTKTSDGNTYTCVANSRAALGALARATVLEDGQVSAIYLVPDDVVEVSVDGRSTIPQNNLAVLSYREGSVVTITADSGDATAVITE